MSIKIIKIQLCLIALCMIFGCHTGVRTVCQEYWVATNGDDSATGDKNHPFKTLNAARDAIREYNNKQACKIINIKGGTYRLSEPFALEAQDSGTSVGPITYKAAENETVFILGSIKINGWTLHDAGLNIWKAQTDIGSSISRQLYVNGNRAIRARTIDYPNYYTPTTTGYVYNYTGGLDPQIPPNWNNPTVIEAVTVTQWKMMRCPIAQIISGSNVIMQKPCWDNANVFPSPWNFHLLSWWENAYEFLDTPNEWYLDPVTKTLYYIPSAETNLSMADVELPIIEFLIQGYGTSEKPISYINFEGLNFAYATWFGPNTSDGYALDQSGFHLVGDNHKSNLIGHDPNDVRTPGNLSFEYAQHISFINNTFSHMGAVALDFGTGTQSVLIENNTFNDISAAAIQIGGIGLKDHHSTKKTELTKNNKIKNNFIQYTGQDYYDAPGIYLGFSTNSTIEENQIQHTSWSGIAIGWGWGLLDPGGFAGLPNAVPYEWGVYTTPSAAHQNKIIHNKIQYFLEKLWDGGAIYSTGFQGVSMNDGLMIERNIALDKRPNAGGNTFYTDGGSRYVTLSENVSVNNPQGFFDFGPCFKASSFDVLCLTTNIIPYGADMGGCIPYGEMLFESNYFRDRFSFYDICQNSYFPNYPIDMVFINNKQITNLSEVPESILLNQ